MRPFAPVGRAPAVTLLLLLAGACSDQIVESRPPPETGGIPGTPIALQKVACRGSLSSLTVRCGSPESGGSGDIIIGGQNVYVTLASSNVAYNGGTGQFTFDVTVKSLIEQPIGTTDGVTLDPGGVRVFFEDGPDVTSGTGSAAVIPDGFGTFTAAGQPYYQYGDVLEQNEVSTAKTWTIVMPPTVTTFNFLLYVAAPVQWPDGYITLNGALPGALYGSIHPGENEALVAVIKSPVGNPLPGAVTFGTTNPACATVDGTGTMTGVQAATCSITAESGALTGSMVCDVTGAVRQWDGSVSSDWSVGGV